MKKGHRRAWSRGSVAWVAMAVVLSVLGLLSRRGDVFIGANRHAIFVTQGGIWLMDRPDVTRFEFHVSEAAPKVVWWPPVGYIAGFRNSTSLDVRLWVFPTCGVIVAGALQVLHVQRRRTRAAMGECAVCRYDRCSLPKEAACPECGEMPMITTG